MQEKVKLVYTTPKGYFYKITLDDRKKRVGRKEFLSLEACFKSVGVFVASKKPEFKFVDLFAGIGGFRLALQNLKGECVFSSEWDKYSKQTYRENFGEIPFGDIREKSIMSHMPSGVDILCAGFPCQAFSSAGKRDGFEDTRGTLFFNVAEIVKETRPKAILLENV